MLMIDINASARALFHRELLSVCIDALNKFDPKSHSVEDYIKTFLKTQKNLDDDDHIFIVEVFSGCVQYTKILHVVVDGFFATDGKTTSHSNTHLYNVLCYMIIFRIDELGLSHLNKFINCQNVLIMHRFLNFFLNEKNLNYWIYDKWCHQYDKRFVDEEVFNPLMSRKEDLDAIVQRLEDKMNNKISKKMQKKPLTQPKAFNLTKAKPKTVPLPIRMPSLAKHKPVPRSSYIEPKEVETLTNIRGENQRRAEQNLLSANDDQFLCARKDKSIKTQMKMIALIDEENAKLNFDMKHTRPLPDHVSENRPIKLNAATVLREGALFQKKEKQELEKLEKLLRGEHNASDFLEWQKSTQQKDLQEQLVKAEQRKVMGKLSREEAILAKQNHTREKRDMVSQYKFENAKMMQEYLALRLDEEKQMRNLVEQITQGHQDTQEAKIRLQEYKRQIVQEVNQESRELMRRALEEAEEEMRRKSKLIQEIRAIESVPVNRMKLVDLTTTAGYAFLSEMSVAELKERLCLLKEAREKELDAKKDAILKEKQAKNDAIMETIARISVHRNEISKAAGRKAEEKARQLKMQEDKVKQDDRVLALQEKLEQKKEERLRRTNEMFVEPSKKTSVRTQGLLREKKRLEGKRWQQVEKGYQKLAEEKLRNTSSKSSSRLVDGKFSSTHMLKSF